MANSNMDISPEDREILAKTKFGQWFDENMAEKFGGAFDTRLNEIASLGEGIPRGTGTTTSGKTAEDAEAKGKRRSLLSMSLEQALGL